MTKPAMRPLRIMVVDDEDLICTSIKMVLNCDGHAVETASGGAEALSRMASGGFDLVFTDYSMPGMNGSDLAKAIKEGATPCPVVMITAYAQMLPPRMPHVDCVLSKPFSRQDLREAIAAVM